MSIVSHGIASSAIETHSLAQAGTKALEAYIAAGDIGKLDAGQRIALYKAVCDSLGLNPLTQPFEYLRLSGGVQLYAKKSATEQLRQIHGVSVLALEQEMRGDILCMTARVRDRSGREDIATGAVNLKGLAGEALANAYMKCETKAKRRATLSICGLAMLDETEIDSIAGAKPITVEEFHAPAKVVPSKALPPSREERRQDLEELTSPIPQAERRAEPIIVGDDEITILARSVIGVVEGKGGRRVWRIDQDDQPMPIAVLDPEIASGLEANQAFSVNTRCRVKTRPNGGLEVVEILGDAQ
jgi:hypothetical protein